MRTCSSRPDNLGAPHPRWRICCWPTSLPASPDVTVQIAHLAGGGGYDRAVDLASHSWPALIAGVVDLTWETRDARDAAGLRDAGGKMRDNLTQDELAVLFDCIRWHLRGSVSRNKAGDPDTLHSEGVRYRLLAASAIEKLDGDAILNAPVRRDHNGSGGLQKAPINSTGVFDYASPRPGRPLGEIYATTSGIPSLSLLLQVSTATPIQGRSTPHHDRDRKFPTCAVGV